MGLARATKASQVIWSLVIALSLTFGLLLAFSRSQSIEAKSIGPGVEARLTSIPGHGRLASADVSADAREAVRGDRSAWAPAPPSDDVSHGTLEVATRARQPDPVPPADERGPSHRSEVRGAVGSTPAASALAPAAGGSSVAPPMSGEESGGPPLDRVFATGQAGMDGFVADLAYDVVWGYVTAGDTITLSRTGDGAYGAAEADGVGFFWTPLWKANGQPADV
ncbi:MAG: hypothetical protein PVH41_11245, partial [Anaerolineae bacterium]